MIMIVLLSFQRAYAGDAPDFRGSTPLEVTFNSEDRDSVTTASASAARRNGPALADSVVLGDSVDARSDSLSGELVNVEIDTDSSTIFPLKGLTTAKAWVKAHPEVAWGSLAVAAPALAWILVGEREKPIGTLADFPSVP